MCLIHISSFSRLRCSQNIVKNLVSEWYLCLYHWKLVSYFLDCMQKYYFSANSKTLIYSHFTWHLVFIWSLDFGLSNEYSKSKSPCPVCKHSSDKLINSPFSKLLLLLAVFWIVTAHERQERREREGKTHSKGPGLELNPGRCGKDPAPGTIHGAMIPPQACTSILKPLILFCNPFFLLHQIKFIF